MEQQRRLVDDEVLVEVEAIRHTREGDRRVDAIDARRDLVDAGKTGKTKISKNRPAKDMARVTRLITSARFISRRSRLRIWLISWARTPRAS
jgi:hypothetical protein